MGCNGEVAHDVLDPRIRSVDMDDPESLGVCLDDAICLVEGKVGVYVGPGRRAAAPQICSSVERTAMDLTRRAISSAAFRATRGWHLLVNTLLNFDRAAVSPTVERLRGIRRDQAVVVVGAGPSLDHNVTALAARRDRAYIVCCDGAWRTLTANGIVPDLVVSTDDSEKVWRHVEQAVRMGLEVPLVCLLHSSWPVVRHYPGPLLFAHALSPCKPFVDRHFATVPSLDSGLCVGHAAFEVACMLGGRPIILVGFDLGYRADRFHAMDMAVPYYDDHPPSQENLLTVAGLYGRPVRTDMSMLLYLREFERRIAGAGVPVWDATEGGARIVGTRVVCLEDALDGLPAETCRTTLAGELGRANVRGGVAGTRRRLETMANALLDDLRQVGEVAVKAVGPDTERTPFACLDPHRDIMELLSGALNPVHFAGLLHEWQDWLAARRNGDPAPAALFDRAVRYFADLAATTRLIPAIGKTALRAEESPDTPAAPKALVYRAEDTRIEAWEGLLKELSEQMSLRGAHAKPDDLPAVWLEIAVEQADVVVSLEGAVLPAGWGMPGCACLDVRSGPPGGDVLREHWLPGYGVVSSAESHAAAWRRRLPPDCPVFLVDGHGRLVSGDDTCGSDWRTIGETLRAEAGPFSRSRGCVVSPSRPAL